jgi:DNA anti-recombination protein RmuC
MNNNLRVDASHSEIGAKLYLQTLQPALFATTSVAAQALGPSSTSEKIPQDLHGSVLQSEHLSDLIDQLQTWAARLDSREATLNAREAVLDHRERVARTAAASLRRDLEEQIHATKVERDRLRHELRAQLLSEMSQPQTAWPRT